jgi:hypothetical protein
MNFQNVTELYDILLNAPPPQVRRNFVFFGGTTPYAILGDTRAAVRDFGDIDIYVPAGEMQTLRTWISGSPKFAVTRDSFELLSPPDGSKKDFGFECKITGMGFENKIGFTPLLGSANILSRGIRTFKKHGDFLVEYKILKDFSPMEFKRIVNIGGCEANVVPLEYTLASKLRTMKQNLAHRAVRDKCDIDFMKENSEKLGIDPHLVAQILQKLPVNGREYAYKVENKRVVAEYSGEEFTNNFFERV